MGPNDISQSLTDTGDIGVPKTSTGAMVTSGELYWADGQLGAQPVRVVIQPYTPGVWHVEKRYFISICSIRSNSSLTEAGQISPTAGTVTLVVCITMFLLCLEMPLSFTNYNKQFSYHRETALQGGLVLDRSGRLEWVDNILQTL